MHGAFRNIFSKGAPREGTRTNIILRLTSTHVRRSPAERYAAECVRDWESHWMSRTETEAAGKEEL